MGACLGEQKDLGFWGLDRLFRKSMLTEVALVKKTKSFRDDEGAAKGMMRMTAFNCASGSSCMRHEADERQGYATLMWRGGGEGQLAHQK